MSDLMAIDRLRGAFLAAILTVMGVAWGIWSTIRLGSAMPAWVDSIVFGVALVAAALFLLWAVEATQVDLSPSLVVLLLALAALLPEWVVAYVFALRSHDLITELGWHLYHECGV
jgi:hypothetical protein